MPKNDNDLIRSAFETGRNNNQALFRMESPQGQEQGGHF